MIDIPDIWDKNTVCYTSDEVFIRSLNNPDDGQTHMTKFRAFYYFLQSEKCDFIVEQRFIHW